MKRIVFFTRGGGGFGMGHLYRTWWIYSQLSDAQARDGALYRLEVHCVDREEAWRFWAEREARVFWVPELEDDADYLLAANRLEYPCTVVVDWLESPPAFTEELKRRGARVVLLDDYGPAQDHAQLVINALLSPLAEHTEYRLGTRILSGVKYVALPPEATALRYTAEAAAQQLEPGVLPRQISTSDVFGVMVSFGGTARLQENMLSLFALSACAFSGRVLVMPADELLRETDWTRIHEQVSTEGRVMSGLDVELHAADDSFHALLAASDMAILAGGLTLYQAAMLGIPAVCIALVDHQEQTARKLAQAGTCVYAGRMGSLTVLQLAETLEALLNDPARRSAMADAGPKLVDGAGLSRIVQEILDVAGLLPRG